MDASSLEFFQKQVASLERDLQQAQDELINDLERRTSFSKGVSIDRIRNKIVIGDDGDHDDTKETNNKDATTTTTIVKSSPIRSSIFHSTSWEEKMKETQKTIDELTQQLAEARSTCAFIIQRQRDKIHLLSSTDDALVSCLCLISLEGGGTVSLDPELPLFISELTQWNESRGLTGVLHVFSSWCALYIEGQKSIVSNSLFWLKSKSKTVKILHKNGFPCGAPEAETPIKARKVPNCTLHVEWHTGEDKNNNNNNASTTSSSSATSSTSHPHTNSKNNTSTKHQQQRAVIDSMLDTLGKTATEAIDFAPVPTYLLSQLQSMKDDKLNPSRLMSTDTFTWHPSQGRFYLAFAVSGARLDGRAATIVSNTLRQRLQRSQGSCVLTPWGVGPMACIAVLQNHPARNVLEEATALPEALSEALKSAAQTISQQEKSSMTISRYSKASFVCAVAWSDCSNKNISDMNEEDDDDDDECDDARNKSSTRTSKLIPNNRRTSSVNIGNNEEQYHRPDNTEDFFLVNSSTASVIGWGVRKLRCMIQFAMENNENAVFTTSFVDRLSILERQRIRLVARVKFHRCMESDDVWAPPEDGVLSSTAKSIDEQLRNIASKNKKELLSNASSSMLASMHRGNQKKFNQIVGGRRQGLVSDRTSSALQEQRGLRDLEGFDVLAQEREKMRKENEERNHIEGVFFALPSFDENATVLVKDAVHYWMTCDPAGLDSVHYPKVRRLMNASGIDHEDPFARMELDRFFVVTNRLRNG